MTQDMRLKRSIRSPLDHRPLRQGICETHQETAYETKKIYKLKLRPNFETRYMRDSL